MDKAWAAFTALGDLLRVTGIQEAVDKASAPSSKMIFLGIQVDTVALSLTIPDEKMEEIRSELRKWQTKSKANLKEVQQLAGHLNYAASCIQPARIYMARFLNFLREVRDNKKHTVPITVRSDVQWWLQCASKFNGVALMLNNLWSLPDAEFSSSACLMGVGAWTKNAYFYFQLPQSMVQWEFDINQLECATVVVL